MCWNFTFGMSYVECTFFLQSGLKGSLLWDYLPICWCPTTFRPNIRHTHTQPTYRTAWSWLSGYANACYCQMSTGRAQSIVLPSAGRQNRCQTASSIHHSSFFLSFKEGAFFDVPDNPYRTIHVATFWNWASFVENIWLSWFFSLGPKVCNCNVMCLRQS